jgi:outer membrane murein-binding lipoprotein Lpp
MQNKLVFTFLIITFLTFLPGCQIYRKYQIESELKQLKPQQELLKQSMENKNRNLSVLQTQANKLNTELTANHNATVALLRNNPGKVACMASGTVAISENNIFSEDIKELGAAIGIGCLAIYIFSEDFQKEVDEFVEEINQSSERDKLLRSQIVYFKPKIEAEKRIWQTEKKAFDEISQKVTNLEMELEKLR